MANIKLTCNKKTNPANLNLRFYHGRNIDCNAKTNILINPQDWSDKMQNFKPNTKKDIKDTFLPLIENIKAEIVRKYNIDYSNGIIINSKWLTKTIEELQKRPEGKEDHTVFLLPFIDFFAKESETRINDKTGRKISPLTIQKYFTLKNILEKYEEEKKIKLKIIDINLKFHKEFTTYLKTVKKYANNTIEKYIKIIKGFIREAKEKGFEINPEAESSKFTFKKDETIDTYLNVEEINLIYNLDLSKDEKLDNVRDLFIIGLWTGLRISDLKKINQFRFTAKKIIISESQKTGTTIELPIFPQVEATLKKYNGNLPKIISDQKFNLYVKEVCKMAKINELILGNKKDENNRKVKDFYPKHELISSHTARRSFATNMYGKFPDKTIMAITGHKSHSQFLSYIKTTQDEHIDNVTKQWAEFNEIKKDKPILKVAN